MLLAGCARRTQRNKSIGALSPSFVLPFLDLGSGIVSTTPLQGNVSPTFARAGVATTKLSTGLFFTVAGGSPRSRYAGLDNALNTTYLGYYAEGTRVNQALWSRDLTDASSAAWTKVSCTVALDQTNYGGGPNSASSILATGAGATCLQSVTLASAAKTFSAYVKRLTGTGTVSITLDGGTTTTDITALINSSNYSQVFATQTLANPSIGFVIATSGDKIAVDGVMLEDSASFPTTPVITTSATATRNADVLTYPSSPWYNTSVGTVVATVLVPYLAGASQFVWQIDDGSANNKFIGFISSTGKAVFSVTDSTVLQAQIGTTAVTAGTAFKFACAWAANDFAISVNGGAAETDSSGTIPAGITTLHIGTNQGTSSNLYGGLKDFKYFPQRLPNSQLQSLST